MKKLTIFVLMTVFVLSSLAAQQAASAPAVEISFDYTRLSGSGSNQFAIWVEDSNGQFIKTLFATQWTAVGGYVRRPMSIPLWIERAGVSRLTRAQVDAVSGATPRTGTIMHTWDGTNSAGRAVPNGDYVIILEGTLRFENQVYYRAPIRLGQDAARAQVSVEYVGDAANNDRSMISNVQVRTLR